MDSSPSLLWRLRRYVGEKSSAGGCGRSERLKGWRGEPGRGGEVWRVRNGVEFGLIREVEEEEEEVDEEEGEEEKEEDKEDDDDDDVNDEKNFPIADNTPPPLLFLSVQS